MLKRFFLSGNAFVFLIAITLLIGCRKGGGLAYPAITDAGMPGGKDSIWVGDNLSIHPAIYERENVSYRWFVNGNISGTDSVLVFSPKEPGTYKIDFKSINAVGDDNFTYEVFVWGKYQHGIFLVNEGWLGTDNGSVNFYRYGRDTIEQMVYKKENPGKELGASTQSGVVFNGKLYLVSKQGPLVVTDAQTLKETGRITTLPADGRAFVGIDNNNGLISTADGIYKLNLSSLIVGNKVNGVNGETGSLKKEGNYIFAISQADGLVAFDQNSFDIKLTIPGMTQGLAKTADGKLWVAGGDLLYSINPATLDTVSITLPFSLGDPWFAWNEGTLTASTKENAVYIGKTEPWGAGGTEIYKYIPANPSSLSAPIATLPENQEFYGAGIRYNPTNDELVVTAVQSGWGQNYKYNSLYFYSPGGTLKKTVKYEYLYFPALPIFN
ncbi:MAG: DUF5074 domain-containing protein [Chitinophagaceae bacterium]|nr:DUF5074 domain-containing protein [Chitinophagaceae bacterium]